MNTNPLLKKSRIIKKSDFRIIRILLNIGDHEFSITDQFTLIRGKFEKDLLKAIGKENIFKNLKEFDSISLEDFVSIIQIEDNEFHNFDKSLNLLDFLGDYYRITNFNSVVLNRFNDFLKSLNLTLSFYLMVKKKNSLKNELEITEIIKGFGDLQEDIELVKNLEYDLKINEKQLKFLEEDYSLLKNQRNRIRDKINSYKLEINTLNQKIKENRLKIDKITTETEQEGQLISERIKNLQKQIRDFQYKIKAFKSKLDKTQLQLDNINPKFERINNDYQSIITLIDQNTNQLFDFKNNLKEKLKLKENIKIKDINFKELNWLKSPNEIEEELQKLESEIKNISNSPNIKSHQQEFGLSDFTNESIKIEETIVDNQDKLKISRQQDEIIDSIKKFRKLENLINILERILNKFLIQINLESSLNIIVNEDNSSFIIQQSFIRSKEIVNFSDLTTPEKVFFLIILYISIKILLKSYNIIFSNKFLPIEYNKRGSVYRTIRKVIPVFETNKELKDFNLIFIISNLEMKKPIENIKIINIDEETNGKQ